MLILLRFYSMGLGNIIQDQERFRRMVRGHIKNDLTRYLTRDEIIGKQGNKIVRIPVPTITIPRFRYETRQLGGVAQGDGDQGDPVFGDQETGTGDGAGLGDDGNLMDVDIFVNDLEDLLIEELGLPYLEPRGMQNVHAQKPIYRNIAEKGTKINFKRTYKEALKRHTASGEYQPGDAVIPTRRDMRYNTSKLVPDKRSSAVLIYMLDVSGSVDEEQKRLFRIANYWIQRLIRRYYHNVEERFIVHTSEAHEVESTLFYETRLSGGTVTSSALEKSVEIINKHYPPEEWNIYQFYYSDGDNYSSDNDKALAILGNQLLPIVDILPRPKGRGFL